MLGFREHGIFEERACALAIGIAGDDEHSLQGADMADGFTGLGQVWRGFAASEVALEVGIGEARLAFGSERVSDAQNDEASAPGGVEDAGAVGESASFAAEFAELAI